MNKLSSKVLIPALLVMVSGCATIVGDPTYTMPIDSNPNDASIMITDEKGAEVFKGRTPTTVTLQKGDGSYFGGKSYTVRISKDGYETQDIPITSSPNGWYIGGNIIFGGLIGWLIVDPLNGDMYNLSPDKISASMSIRTGHNNTSTDGGVSVVLLQDVPAELVSEMTRIN